MVEEVREKIDHLVSENKIILFMKGSVEMPRCGFSAKAVEILNSYDVSFKSVDVLEAPLIRQGIKEYGNWPTIPQLYVSKKLIGGSDILTSLHESGELKAILSS